MRKLSFVITLVVCLSVTASAQTGSGATAPKSNGGGYGYVFFGPGGSVPHGGEATMHVGGGGEAVFKNGAGIGAELAYLAPFKYPGDGLGTFSVNGSYHFLKTSGSEKVVPFLTGGYTGFFRDGYANGVNFGAGVNYWFKPRVGLRVEFRDHIWVENESTHFLNVRVGLNFR